MLHVHLVLSSSTHLKYGDISGASIGSVNYFLSNNVMRLVCYSFNSCTSSFNFKSSTPEFFFCLRLLFAYILVHAFNAPYLHFCLSSDSKTEPKFTFSQNKQNHDPHSQACNGQHSWLATTYLEPKHACSLPCQK